MEQEYSKEQRLGFCSQFRLAKHPNEDWLYTSWEREFIKSVAHQEQTKGYLSDKQWAIVQKLFIKLVEDMPEALEDEPEPEGQDNSPLPTHLQRNPHRTYSQESDYDDDIPF